MSVLFGNHIVGFPTRRLNLITESGRLEREEFETMIANYIKPKEEIELELKDAFRVFDRNGDGFIDREGIEKQFI